MIAFTHSNPAINVNNPDKIFISYTITFEEEVEGKLIHYRKEYGLRSYKISLAKIKDYDQRLATAKQLRRLVLRDLENGIDPKYRNETVDKIKEEKIKEAKKIVDAKVSFTDAVEMTKRAKGWINAVEGKDTSATSILSLYNNDFKRYIHSIDKQDDIRSMSKNEIKQYLEQHFNPVIKGDKEWSSSTCRTSLGWISILFTTLLEAEHIQINPCTGIKIKSDSEKIHSVDKDEHKDRFERWTDEELEILFNETDSQDLLFWKAVSSVVFYSFIRKAELLRLKVWMVDFKNERFTIPPSKTKSAKKYKTKDKVMVDMPDALVDVLRKWIIYKYPTGFTNDDYLFPSSKHRTVALPKNTINSDYRVLRIKLQDKYPGLFDKNIYALKHSGVTRLFNTLKKSDNTPMEIMEIIKNHCRHSSFNQTETYLRSLQLDVNATRKKVNF